MKRKLKQPEFNREGYQVGLTDINDEPLPDLAKAKVVSRERAGLPSPEVVRTALATIRADEPATYVEARSRAGLTQEEFAAAIGVNLATYRQWEHGRRKPSGPARTLLKLLVRKPSLIRELRKTG